MWSVLKWLALRFTVLRWISKILSLSLFVPIALLLKTIGLPALIILAILAMPVLLMLFLFGLPFFLVILAGGVTLAMLFAALSVGMLAIKFVVFVVLPIWLLWQLAARLFPSHPKPKPAEP